MLENVCNAKLLFIRKEKLVEPIKVISSTSLLIDFYFKCQVEEKELKINWKRVTTTSLFGFAFVGPVGHFW